MIKLNSFFTALAILGYGSLLGQIDILDARTNFIEGDIVTVEGVVTSGTDLGSVRYIQDETAGIAIYPGSDWTSFEFEPQPGDYIVVNGELTEYYGLLEVGSNIISMTLVSSGNTLPDPQVITPSQLNEAQEGELVVIHSTTFEAAGQIVEGNSTYTFNSAGQQGEIYVKSTNSLVGTTLNGCEMNLVGICSQHTYDGVGGYQLLPRGPDDLVSTSAICLATEVVQTNLTTSSFDLSWTTDVEGDSEVNYGLTSALGMTESVSESVLEHTVTLSGLEAGKLYYASVKSTTPNGEVVSSPIRVYATVSNSSGNIHAFFVGSVDTSVATIEEAVSTGTQTNDQIAEWITSAQYTLELAFYNLNNVAIENAINTAVANGVDVRLVVEGSTSTIGIGNLDPLVDVVYRTDGGGSGMHNKFIVGDADYVESAFVLTGSTNMTTGNLNSDRNNVIVLEDQSLARAYRLEFEEMFSGVFGADKTINTPKKFVIGGSPVELYFSPTDGTNSAIKSAIETTDYSLIFAVMSFTRDDISETIISQSSIFTSIQGVIEDESNSGSEFVTLDETGIDVYSHEGVSGIMHNKYAVVDHVEPLSDPIVITGSHNWSSSAENVNDENTLFIHDARVANLYYQEFIALLFDLGIIGVDLVDGEVLVSAFPNPATSILNVVVTNEMIGESHQLVDVSGRTVKTFQPSNTVNQIEVADLESGVYFLNSSKLSNSIRVVIE